MNRLVFSIHILLFFVAIPMASVDLKPFSLRMNLVIPRYRPDQIKEVKNVPLEVRDVPVHPNDMTKTSSDSSWSKPISNSTAEGSDAVFIGLDIDLGLNILVPRESNWYAIRFFGGTELFMGRRNNYQQRNYLIADRPTIGDSLSYSRVSGAALTWYAISTLPIRPYVCIEGHILFFDGEDAFLSFSLGYKASYEKYTLDNGWDRYNSYQRYERFDLLELITGTPYFSVKLGVVDYGKNQNLLLQGINFDFGFKHVIRDWSTDLSRRCDVDLHRAVFYFGMYISYAFL